MFVDTPMHPLKSPYDGTFGSTPKCDAFAGFESGGILASQPNVVGCSWLDNLSTGSVDSLMASLRVHYPNMLHTVRSRTVSKYVHIQLPVLWLDRVLSGDCRDLCVADAWSSVRRTSGGIV